LPWWRHSWAWLGCHTANAIARADPDDVNCHVCNFFGPMGVVNG
jgi:hypothetical protein